MSVLSDLLQNPKFPQLPQLAIPSNVPWYSFAIAGAATLGAVAVASTITTSTALRSDRPRFTHSPKALALSQQQDEASDPLPYPLDALPGARDVPSPYGPIRLYEWGAEDGDRVLLLHGISTPSIALAGLAHELVDKGCRVMLLDLFGRGYSSAPDPEIYRYDSALYASQILIALQASPLPWKPFTLIGYSLGGAISADFTSYFPSLVANLILIAPGGLIRTSHVTWKSRFLYSTGGILPQWFIERIVARRLYTGPPSARSVEPEPDTVSGDESLKGGLRSKAVYQSSHTALLDEQPNSTVGNVVDWQIANHKGFVPAFISSIRYAPIHDQHERWRVVGENITCGVSLFDKVHVVLGELDPIIVPSELEEDVKAVLGEANVNVEVLKGTGHEVAIDKAGAIADLVDEVLWRE